MCTFFGGLEVGSFNVCSKEGRTIGNRSRFEERKDLDVTVRICRLETRLRKSRCQDYYDVYRAECLQKSQTKQEAYVNKS